MSEMTREHDDLTTQPSPYSGDVRALAGRGNVLREPNFGEGGAALAQTFACNFVLKPEDVAAIVLERNALRTNLTAVQARCTEQQEEIRVLRAKLVAAHEKATGLKSMVAAGGSVARSAKAFARLAGQPIPTHPVVPDEARIRLRLRLLDEALEVLEACLDDGGMTQSLADLRARFYHLVDNARVKVDLVALADGLADTVMVCEGFFAECGINSAPVHDEVWRSNASKFPAVLDATGKVTKPPHYSPPDLAGVLERQGWDRG
jgi:predicted HAD superfamily Cof-like phosphohydrolase